MKPTETSRGASWTDYELGLLHDESATVAEVALMTGRSENAVRLKRQRLRAGWVPSRNPDWTSEELEVLAATKHLAAHEVAELLMIRSADSVKKKRQEMCLWGPGGLPHMMRNRDPHRVGGRRLAAKTCLGCGLLLDGSWFYRSKQGWASRCARCHNDWPGNQQRSPRQSDRGRQAALARDFSARMAALTGPLATRHRQPWLDREDAVLSDSTLTLLQKALRLQRTYAAVATQCAEAGYTSKRQNGLGEPTDAQWIIHLPGRNEDQEGAA